MKYGLEHSQLIEQILINSKHYLEPKPCYVIMSRWTGEMTCCRCKIEGHPRKQLLSFFSKKVKQVGFQFIPVDVTLKELFQVSNLKESFQNKQLTIIRAKYV